jgi:hypothetical protein
MHPFGIIGGLLHATALVVFAFFVWFAAARSTGWLKMLGNVLGAWLVIIGVVGLVMAIIAPGMGWHGRHMHNWPTAQAPAAATNTTP